MEIRLRRSGRRGLGASRRNARRLRRARWRRCHGTRRLCGAGAQWIIGVIQVIRFAGRGYLHFPELSPVRPKQQAVLEFRNSKVELKLYVEVVTANGSIDEVLGEREDRRCREREAKPRSDVGERADGRLQVFRFLTKSACVLLISPVAVLLNMRR